MSSTDIPAGSGPLGAAAGTWTLDPAATTIDFQTKAMWGLVKVKGSFKAVEGAATIADDESFHATLIINAATIDTGNKKRDNHLRSSDFLESDRYPTLTYLATSASRGDNGTVNLGGTLSVHGQTHPLDIAATIAETGSTDALVKAQFDIDRRVWGITWSKMGAKVVNQITVNARFHKN